MNCLYYTIYCGYCDDMSISFSKKRQVFLLNTPSSTYIIRIVQGRFLLHGGWFHHIQRWSDQCVLPAVPYPFEQIPAEIADSAPFSLDTQQLEYPCGGRTDYRTPAIETETADGTYLLDLFYSKYRIIPGKPGLPGLPAVYTMDKSDADTLEIDMTDEKAGIVVTLSYSVWNTCDAICRHVTVYNSGKGEGIYKGSAVILRRVMSMSLDFADARYRLLTLSGTWARERHPVFSELHPGTQSIESRRGMSSHQENPFVALCSQNADEEKGEVFGCSLVYSGNFTAMAEVNQYAMTRVQAGINPDTFTWKLEKGESFCTPECVMVRSEAGLGGMSQVYHSLYRNNLCRGKWKYADRPIVINNWEATHFQFTEKALFAIADAAVKAGAEMFVLDDGWFGSRNDDTSSLGDWTADQKKLPGGLRALAEGMKSRGLAFGLWVEPEMVSPDSDLYRTHPDWCLHIQGRSRSLGRSQYVLDLSRKDVVDYLIQTMTDVFASADISYVKWDCNRNITEAGSETASPEHEMETSHRYVLGLYRLLETLTNRFPDILFESCSGGGGRFDPGMFYYMPQCWASDNTDALSRIPIQMGTSMVYPPSCMVCHVTAVPNQQTQRITPLLQRTQTAMAGVYGYELNLAELSEQELAVISRQTDIYRRIRHTVLYGMFYRLETPWEYRSPAESAVFAAWENVSSDRKQAVVTSVWIYAEANAGPIPIQMKGLAPEMSYRIVESSAEQYPDGLVFGGDELMYAGLRLLYHSGGVQIIFEAV